MDFVYSCCRSFSFLCAKKIGGVLNDYKVREVWGVMRGQMSPQAIIGLVLAILAFVLAAYLLIELDFSGQSDEDICRLSVLTRATSPQAGQSLIPLKCYTSKICLYTGGSDKCPQFAGEEKIAYVKVSEGAAGARVIEEEFAKGLYGCWSMMGEGKLDLFSGSGESLVASFTINNFAESEKKPTCVICSRVALSIQLQKDSVTLGLVNVGEYMKTNGPSNSELTYLQLMSDPGVRSFPAAFDVDFQKKDKTKETSELGFIFMQILTKDDPSKIALTKGTSSFIASAATFFGFAPGGNLNPSVFATKAGLTVLATGVSSGVSYFNALHNQDISALQCGSFTSQSDARKGCSIVKPIDYNNVGAINAFCGRIEGNP